MVREEPGSDLLQGPTETCCPLQLWFHWGPYVSCPSLWPPWAFIWGLGGQQQAWSELRSTAGETKTLSLPDPPEVKQHPLLGSRVKEVDPEQFWGFEHQWLFYNFTIIVLILQFKPADTGNTVLKPEARLVSFQFRCISNRETHLRDPSGTCKQNWTWKYRK